MEDIIVCKAYTSFKNKVEFVTGFPEQDEWSEKWDLSEMFYDVINESRSISIKDIRKALNFAMTTWDVEIDLDFYPVWAKKWRNKKPEITIEFKNSSNDNLFETQPSVLAYAYFPGQGLVSGKVVFNDDYIWGLKESSISVKEARKRGYPVKGNPPEDTQLKIYNIIQVLIHELGHMLGLKHDVTANRVGKDVMDPFYDGKVLDLSERDIYRIHLKYLVESFENWSRYDLFKRWLKLRVRRF